MFRLLSFLALATLFAASSSHAQHRAAPEAKTYTEERAETVSADPARAARLQQRVADAISTSPRAEVFSFSGNTTGASTWHRPRTVGNGTSGSCLLSSEGTDVPYETHAFTVSATGSYDVYARYEPSYDGFLYLYEYGQFDPGDPCLYLTALNDHFNGTTHSLIAGEPLVAGTVYIVVVSGNRNNSYGSYDGGVYDAGTIPITLTVSTALDEFDDSPGDFFCEGGFFTRECTLRAAIEEANALPNNRKVFIDIAVDDGPPGSLIGPGVWRIQPNDGQPWSLGPLPAITQPHVTIDGLTQPGASCGDLTAGTPHDLRIILDGSLLPSGEGLRGSADSLTVRGLVVQNFPASGIIGLGDNTRIECNYTGTDYTGESAAGNLFGIVLTSGEGGVLENNLVSANVADGIIIDNMTAAHVAENLIGSDVDGEEPLGNGAAGLQVSGGSNMTIRKNLVSGNAFQGLFLSGTIGATLWGNTIGLKRGNRVAPGMGNGSEGILVTHGALDNSIGCSAGNSRNYIGSNGQAGILISDAGTSNNRVCANYIGLDFFGATAPNSFGIHLDGAEETVIGGLGSGERNVIAGNTLSGINLFGDSDTRIEGNTIGLGLATAAVPNGTVGSPPNSGIDVVSSTGLVIRGNTVSGNNGSGVRFFSDTSANAVIEDNRIGTTPDGSAARPNAETGLVLDGGADFASVTGNTISGNTDTGVFLSGGVTGIILEDNFIGTNAAGADLGNGLPGGDGRHGVMCQDASGVRVGKNFSPNHIRFNGRDGIFVGANCQDIAVVGNIIRDNGDLAVDLAPNAPNPNDAGDADAGANDKLNFPVITAAGNDGANSTIAWTLDAEPNTTYELLFCRTTSPDPSGHGECPVPNALATTTTDAAGDAMGTLTLGAGAYPAGTFVTANATEVDGPLPAGYRKTSEFSASVEVADTAGPPLAVTITPTSPTPVVLQRGDDVFFNLTFDVSASGPSSFEFWTEAVLPNGAVRSPLIGPSTVTVSPPTSLTLSFSQRVPGVAPFGDYTYRAEVGTFPSGVVDSDAFAAEIVPGREAEDTPFYWQAFDAEGVLLDGPRVYDFRTDQTERDVADAASSEAVPTEVVLVGAYPNPSGGRATVAYALPAGSRVVLAVYDVLGRDVARLVDGEVEAGRHEAVLDGSALPSGVYLVRLVVGGEVRTERITLVR